MHTKGPWTIKGQRICGDDGYICTWSGKTANARLIASAPELLEALKQVVADTRDERQVTQSSINKAQKAIRKAKEERSD